MRYPIAPRARGFEQISVMHQSDFCLPLRIAAQSCFDSVATPCILGSRASFTDADLYWQARDLARLAARWIRSGSGGHGSSGCYNHPNQQPLCLRDRPLLIPVDENRSMKTPPTLPNTSDADAAVRIALVREMTEAARNGAIAWSVRDRRLRALFRIEDSSRAFDSSRPC